MKETKMFTEKKGKEQNQPKESTVLMEKEKKKKKRHQITLLQWKKLQDFTL